MKKTSFYMPIFIILLLFNVGCTNTDNQSGELKKQVADLQKQVDSLKIKSSIEPSKKESAGVTQQPSANDAIPKSALRIGKHDFTLQWISWDEPGSVNIQPTDDGWYTIEGGQKSNKNTDYITIKGLIKPVSATELLFKGEIKSVVETNNNGNACVKTGSKIFKTTKNRKYWRLQDMINCEGGMLTDYVDIYF